jgi:hypothetical protein
MARDKKGFFDISISHRPGFDKYHLVWNLMNGDLDLSDEINIDNHDALMNLYRGASGGKTVEQLMNEVDSVVNEHKEKLEDLNEAIKSILEAMNASLKADIKKTVNDYIG